MSLAVNEITAFFDMPLMDLLLLAQNKHREFFKKNTIQFATLFNIKTGACPENCGYCAQSGHFKTALTRQKLSSLDEVLAAAKKAKAEGATRFCMGAAWRSPPKNDLPLVANMITEVKQLGLETCVTLGMLDEEDAQQLKSAGLDFYNHNVDTSPAYYEKIITTHTFQDRLNTLKIADDAGIHLCCGGIMGLGESREDRIQFLYALQALKTPPKSIPINRLVPIKGTPLQDTPPIDDFEFIRTIAVTRLVFNTSVIRLAAGRKTLSDSMQFLCFMAGANSIFYGEKLLTTNNPDHEDDLTLLNQLGMTPHHDVTLSL